MTLYCVTLHAIRQDWRNGKLRVEQGVACGPLAAETEEQVRAYAVAAVRKQFPATRGWAEHGYTYCATPGHVLAQVQPAVTTAAPAAPKPPRRERKQQRRGHGSGISNRTGRGEATDGQAGE